MYRGEETNQFDFSGGLATNKPSSNLDENESPNLRNVIITQGKGLEKRTGDQLFNSVAIGSSSPVTGLLYYKQISGTDYLIAISSSNVYKSDSLDGTFDDVTGSVVITSGQNNIWTGTQMNDMAIFVGGAPNPPIAWEGTGNFNVLSGSPPEGHFGFTHNNRMFIGNTNANPSRIQWSALGNPEDWSGTGSGSQDIERNDGDVLIGAASVSIDTVLLFKQNSIHKFLTRTTPFPYFPLFRGIGAVGKRAIVVANDLVYFITPQAKMAITDGNRIIDEKEIPKLGNIDDIWSGLNSSRLPYTTGVYYEGDGFDHIIWYVSTSGSATNDLALVWDIRNKCWLRHPKGFKSNSVTKTQTGVIYEGHALGDVYKKFVSGKYSDDSETASQSVGGIWDVMLWDSGIWGVKNPDEIDAYWSSNWKSVGSLSRSFHPFRLNVALTSQSGGSLSIGYGYDFSSDKYNETKSMQAVGDLWNNFLWDQGKWGVQSDLIRSVFTKGRGINYQISFGNNTVGQTFKIHGFNILSKKSSQKIFQLV